jgi:diguanylate cyclase (GGDEF)-like protein
MKDNSLKVLVVDDDEDDIFLVKEMLKEGLPESKLVLDYATKGEDAIALIDNGGHDIFLLDLHLGKANGLSMGHDVGDKLLQQVGNRLKECLRQQDTVARLGGDEFILLLPEISKPEDAGTLAQKLLDTVRPPVSIGEHELNLTLSIGIGLYPNDGKDSKSLIKCADEALYLAKDSGRDCYQYYKPSTSPE